MQAKALMAQVRVVAVEVVGNGWILNMFQSDSGQNLLVGWMWNLREEIMMTAGILPEQLEE